MTLREAAQQALVELEVIAEFLPFIDAKQTTAALRAALEQPEQAEPVGQLQEEAFGRGNVMWFHKPADGTVLYTTPPRREWQSLSRDEPLKLWGARSDGPSNSEIIGFARAIEAALKEKNHG